MGAGECVGVQPKITARLADPAGRREVRLARDFGITVNELNGWTPTEVHTPQPDGSVLVTRDSPWTDEERALQDEYDRLVCDACGNLKSVCSSPMSEWYAQLAVCYATADQQVAERRFRAKNKSEPGLNRHPLDGAGVWVSEHDLTPNETAFDLD